MQHWTHASIAAVFVALLATPVFAAHHEGGHEENESKAAHACREAAREKVRHQHPGAESIGFGEEHERRKTGDGIYVTGDGHFKNSEGKKQDFTFECTYNLDTGHAVGVAIHR